MLINVLYFPHVRRVTLYILFKMLARSIAVIKNHRGFFTSIIIRYISMSSALQRLGLPLVIEEMRRPISSWLVQTSDS